MPHSRAKQVSVIVLQNTEGDISWPLQYKLHIEMEDCIIFASFRGGGGYGYNLRPADKNKEKGENCSILSEMFYLLLLFLEPISL